MSNSSLKSKATRGMLWNAFESFSVQGGQLIVTIVLARLLLPADFGLIGMLTIFIAISQTIIESGMGTALVQKQDRTELDFSTVFVFNFGISAIIYALLFFAAPIIANFYETPQLVLLTRVLTLNIIINSLALVQNSRLIINLDFKTIAKANLASVVISGIIAVLLAYSGFGVWALVFQNLIRASVLTALLWYFVPWKPSLTFSKESFSNLFGFGSRLLGASLVATFFSNIYKAIIGKVYSSTSLGYYTQAFQVVDVSSGTITNILQKVTFPILATIQEDEERMVSVYRRMIKMTSFFVFPLMTLLALLADPLVRFFLTEKWLPTVELLQWLCFARIIYPISSLNMNILNAKGRSDLFLKVDLSKLPITIIALVITIPISVKAVVIGHVVTSFIAFFINAYLPGKLFSYGALKQLRDVVPMILATAVMAIVVSLILPLVQPPLLKCLVGGIIGLGSYSLISLLLKIEEIAEIRKLLFNKGEK